MGNTTPPPRSPGAVLPLTRSHLPNMASASWLWRICRGDKANQKRWNILNESVRNSYNLFWKCGCGYFDRSSVEKFKILTMVSFALEIWTSINLKSGFQILPKKNEFQHRKEIYPYFMYFLLYRLVNSWELTLRRQSLVLSSWARNQKKGSSSKMEGTEEKMIG